MLGGPCSTDKLRELLCLLVLEITTPLLQFVILVLTFLIGLHIRSPAARSLWEAMLTSKHKEGVMEVRRQLVETASKEKLPIKMSMGKNGCNTK